MSIVKVPSLIVDNWWYLLLDFFQRLVNYVGDNWQYILGISMSVLFVVVMVKVLVK